MSLRTFVAHRISEALDHRIPWEDVQRQLEIPPRPEQGDFAMPCFVLARQLQQAPAKIGAELAAKLAPHFERVEVVGPYLNFFLHLASAAEDVLLKAPDLTVGRKERVMVEFSQPNTHKVFHVGHMRNLCLGDALVRVLRAVGHEVIAVNYIGDMGVHIAKCLWMLGDLDQPKDMPRGEWLGEVYTKAHLQLSDWEESASQGDELAQARLAQATQEINETHRLLEVQDISLLNTWLHTRQASLEAFEEIYRWADVHFDQFYFESEMSKPSQALVDEFLAKGVFVESRGAIGISNLDLTHMPFFMLRKSNGEGLYATKDLALAVRKFKEYHLDRSLYVVDVRQTDHFRHVFMTLKKMGFAQADRCEHVPYEMVDLPDGPMSARKGNVVLFRSLRERMVEHIRREHLDFYKGEWPEEEIQTCADQLALGAIRYGMLNAGLTQRIVFDMTSWMQLRGNTGPYLQYTATRLGSILRKCEAEGKVWDPTMFHEACAALVDPAERQIVMRLDAFPFRVRSAAGDHRPNMLCSYLYQLCQDANRFFQTCSVKTSEGALLQGRLLLVTAMVRTLTQGLGLLGIPVPFRM